MFRSLASIIFYCLLFVVASRQATGQTCTAIGQNPSTAFPVCGTSVFNQSSVPLCGGNKLPGPCAPVIDDRNPYWYKFTCFKSGTLAFTITPANLSDDYDWQIFDITGRNPNDVYTDASLFVTCNWSGDAGKTGAGPTGNSLVVCEGFGKNVYSQMANIITDHTYLLLISHFTNTQSGYGLSFGGGTASITDTTPPRMKQFFASCDGQRLIVKLNKKMKCNSIAANGSDFGLAPANAVITSATGVGCNSGFDSDSIILTLDKPLTAGTYQLFIKRGSDANTILDYCDAPIPDTNKLSTIVLPAMPTPMDSILPVACKPGSLRLVFSNPILCNTIAANGSDFTVTGPAPVTVTGATGNCVAGSSNIINIQLASPITVAGIYTVTLKTGTDGNTIFNECAKETPAGSKVTFKGYDTVLSTIISTVVNTCLHDTLKLNNPGGNNINSWRWTFDDGITNSASSVSRVYSNGTRTVRLTVSNGVCSDSSQLTISFDKNRVKAVFTYPAFVCPLDTAVFTDSSTGPITNWNWDFGNGQTSTQKIPPPQFYPTEIVLKEFTARLIVSAANGCADSISHTIAVPGNCYIAVPNAFTPNGDGLNDYLYPLNAYKAIGLDFTVYNRFGQRVWHTKDWTRKWDGRVNGKLQPTGTYVWHLVYIDGDNKKRVDLRGTSTLIR